MQDHRDMLALFSILKLALITQCVAGSTPLYFGFVATDSVSAAELIPPLEITLQIINNSSSILPNYQLNFVPWVSECDQTTSLNRFLDIVLENCGGSPRAPTILGLVGCGCTRADQPVAELIHRWNIPQISYSGGSIDVINGERFPNYFQLYSLNTLGVALEAILSEFQWTRLAVLTDNSTRFLEAGEVIYSILDRGVSNLTQNHTIVRDNSMIGETLRLLIEEYRIFFINTYEDTAKEILCYAIRNNLQFPHYVWILNGWFSNDWWVTSNSTGCSNDAVAKFLEDSRVLLLQPHQSSGENIIGGITREEYYFAYREAQQDSGVRFIPEYPLIYDSVWTLALALNTTLANQDPAHNTCASGLPIQDFTYSSTALGAEIRDAVGLTDFNGASGRVFFDMNGIRRQTYMAVQQYRDGMVVEIGRVGISANSTALNFAYSLNESSTTVFPGTIPMDGTPVKVIITFDLWIVGFCYTLAVVGLIFTSLCFLFNIIFRKRRIVRLTSPNLNYFILLGTALIYGTIFVYLIRTTDQQVYRIRCYVQTWTVTIGFTLAFGSIIAKLYRVVHIFKNPSPNKATLSDWKLMIIISLFVGIGLALLLLRLIVPQFRIEPFLASNREFPSGLNELGTTENYCTYRCIGGDPVEYYYQIIYYAYILVILTLALIFALRTRNVKIEVLNDAKWIGAIVYFSVPLLILFFVFTLALSSWLHLSAAIYCIGLFVVSSISLGFIFIPKMVAFAKDPKGLNIFGKDSSYAHSTNGTNNGSTLRHSTLNTVDTPVKAIRSTEKVTLEAE